MENNRKIFSDLLTELKIESGVLERFELYHSLLVEANERVNLISRQTDPEEIWTRHFYDSLLPLVCGFELRDKVILDLGSGGGLPGIPLAITNPAATVYLMDSRGKKVNELKIIIKKLDLKNCYPIYKRLEEFRIKELGKEAAGRSGFDVTVCRSVKITPQLLRIMKDFLKPEGYILLYKGREMEETFLLQAAKENFLFRKPWRETNILKIEKV
jgi:16S rRNA (guanine527-N7)-methyltransferase